MTTSRALLGVTVVRGLKERETAGCILACLLCVFALLGCSGSGHDTVASSISATPPEATPPPSQRFPTHELSGHFSGLGQLPDGDHYVEALLTVDGAIRLYVAGPLPPGIALSGGGIPTELLNSADAALFAGNFAPDGHQGAGDGLVFGMVCGEADTGRFCDQPVAAVIEIEATRSGFVSELRVETGGGQETWLLDVGEHSVYYDSDASLPPSGLYRETLARFAQAGDVVLQVDGSGQLFFQSPDSACTGNGAVSPHLDGKHFVWDVRLSIENCDSVHAYLNGNFDGLATMTQGGYWDYDAWLQMFLTETEGSASRMALFSHGEQL